MKSKTKIACLAVGCLTLGTLMLVGTGKSPVIFSGATGNPYTLSVTAADITVPDAGYPYITTALGNKVEVYASKISMAENITLLADGYLYNKDPISGMTSLTVDLAEGSGDVTVDYGYSVDSKSTDILYVKVGVPVTDDVALDWSSVSPNYFRINATADAEIVSISAEYSCESVDLSQEIHMVGAGSFLGEHDNEWTPLAGPKLELNTENKDAIEYQLVDIELTAGDEFKFVIGETGAVDTQKGHWKIKDSNGSAFDKGDLTIEDNGDITVVNTKTYSFYLQVNEGLTEFVEFDGSNKGSWAASKDPVVESELKTVYCKVPHWWWKESAGCAIHYWSGSGGTTWPGIRMDVVSQGTTKDDYSIYSFELDVANFTNFMFVRVNASGTLSDWGAKTVDLSVSEMTTNNMYTIGTTEVWGYPGASGSWSVYPA